MTEIPEDIREDAKSIIKDFTFHNSDWEQLDAFIARAILAEREATTARVREECAKVADAEARICDAEGEPQAAISAERIANAIREGFR
jgi:hypothetical protein